MTHYLLLARRSIPFLEDFLKEYPGLAGLFLCAVGGALLGYGIHGAKTGVVEEDGGVVVTGKMAQVNSVARILGGIGAIIGGSYFIVSSG